MSSFTPYRVIGEPNLFDLNFEEDRFRFGRVVIEKRNGKLINHY